MGSGWGTDQEVLGAWAAPCGATTAQEQEVSLTSPHALAMAPAAAPCFTANYDDLHIENVGCVDIFRLIKLQR